MNNVAFWDRRAASVGLGWAVAAAALAGIIFWLCDGHFVFSLDDPYIHLAVANNILHGQYGVNLAEPSSPSSSILWPWLIAATQALGLGAGGPLALSLLSAGASVLVGLRLLRQFLVIDFELAPVSAYLLAGGLVFLLSALALPLTGLEHSAHVLSAIVVVEALALAGEGKPLGVRHALALAAMPLLRFEGFAFFVAALAALVWLKQWKVALAAFALVALGVALYVRLVGSLGLPLLPSSVLVKSSVTSALSEGWARFLLAFASKLADGFLIGRAAAVAAALAVLIWLSLRPQTRRLRPLLLAVGAAEAAHLAFGEYGWFGRYDVYVVAIGGVAILIGAARAFAAPGRPLVAYSRSPAAAARVAALIAFLSAPALYYTALTPAGALNIYAQQFQMRRLAQDLYPRPIAVNDIGLVSWGNPNYVLDLEGLGSETVRKLRRAKAFGAREIDQLTRARHVELAMIYDEWFIGGVPAGWRRIGELKTSKVSSAGDLVSIYVTPEGDEALALAALERWRADLPRAARLNVFPAAAAVQPSPKS